LSYEGGRLRVSGGRRFVARGLTSDDKQVAVWYFPAHSLEEGTSVRRIGCISS